MKSRLELLRAIFLLICLISICSSLTIQAQVKPPTTALVNGLWFNGQKFEPKTVYSQNGYFSFRKPDRIDTTIDLEDAFIIPPFGEAHNHSIGTGVEEWDKKAIEKFIEGGIFYVMIQGNLPLTAEQKKILGINQPNSLDVSLAQGSLTSTGGHPIFLIEKILLPQGYYKGYTRETLKDNRYFTIDSAADIDSKWPKIISPKPDFIKVFLSRSEDFEKLKGDSSATMKGLDPSLIEKIVKKSHSQHLRVSVHVVTAVDFHNALAGGADIIAHLPRYISGLPFQLIDVKDAQFAAKHKIPVITTVAVAISQGREVKPEDTTLARQHQVENLKILSENGVNIIIGSDDPADNSSKEFFYLRDLRLFDNLTLLKMWVQATPIAIFPDRKIGMLKDGYEASFLALDGDPLEDLSNLQKIKLRFKQGFLLDKNGE